MADDSRAGRFDLGARARSFAYAFAGVATMLRSQPNAWIHALATVLVVVVGFWVGVTRDDWLWLILAMSIVWLAEALNTAVEFLADAVVREIHPLVKHAKDVAAAAVLIAAVGAASIGVLVLGPRLLVTLGVW